MSATRVATPGKTRTCPHCKATILESAAVCPACQHHLRYDPKAVAEQRAQSTLSAMQVEGVIKHPQAAGAGWEYSVVVSIRNDRGEELVRRVIGVGALQPNEARMVSLSFDVFVPPGAVKQGL